MQTAFKFILIGLAIEPSAPTHLPEMFAYAHHKAMTIGVLVQDGVTAIGENLNQ